MQSLYHKGRPWFFCSLSSAGRHLPIFLLQWKRLSEMSAAYLSSQLSMDWAAQEAEAAAAAGGDGDDGDETKAG